MHGHFSVPTIRFFYARLKSNPFLRRHRIIHTARWYSLAHYAYNTPCRRCSHARKIGSKTVTLCRRVKHAREDSCTTHCLLPQVV